jgi:hypothetical protein
VLEKAHNEASRSLMLNAAETDAAERADELAALRAIYCEPGAFAELAEGPDGLGFEAAGCECAYRIRISLRRVDEDAATGASVALSFAQPPGYPSSAPLR